jgi:hypothetical protein
MTRNLSRSQSKRLEMQRLELRIKTEKIRRSYYHPRALYLTIVVVLYLLETRCLKSTILVWGGGGGTTFGAFSAK